MNSLFKQENRMGSLTTDLGKDTLVLTRFEGQDRINDLFEFKVDCLSENDALDFDSLIGTHVTVNLLARDDKPRHFDGIVTEARWVGPAEKGTRYHLTLRPWFWLATLRRSQRIFHNMTVIQIVEKVLGAYGDAGQFDVKTDGDYPVLEYTVQYRESDFDFVSRQLERFGISYHFRHESQAHKMVLTSDAGTHERIGAIPFRPVSGHHLEDIEHLDRWGPARRLTTGAVRLTDYNFKTPTAAMEVDQTGDAAHAQGQLESYDYPGDYLEQADGKDVVRLRTEQERGQNQRIRAEGDVLTLYAGAVMKLTGDKVPGTGSEFVALSAEHFFESDGYTTGGASQQEEAYKGFYTFMPVTAPLAPERKTQRALVHGPQTAKVVGDGEIDCDEFGRILVRFHWDLKGDHSMRCRVSQNWAGPGWGGMVIPRIGMEVVVEFLEGDPDQPLVTGCVYNGRNAVPYSLPENKTRSTFRTDTHEGEGYNELRFEDEKDNEEVFIHAQKDKNVKVRNNKSVRVNVNAVESVGHNRGTEIANNETLVIGGDLEIGVGQGQINRFTPSSADDDESVSGSASQLGLAGTGPGDGNMLLTVEKTRTSAIGTDDALTVGKNRSMTVEGKEMKSVTGEFILDVQERITFICGQSKIVMEPNGTITVNGMEIVSNASSQFVVRAGLVKLN